MEAVTDERSESVTRGERNAFSESVAPSEGIAFSPGKPLAGPLPRVPQGDAPADPAGDDALAPARPRLPPAAAQRVPGLFVLTLLSAVDGSLLALAASGRLATLADAVTTGLVVIAGAGSWLAANQAFAGRRRDAADYGLLALLGVLTLASTVAAVWLGARLGEAATLHVLPKGAGMVLALVAAEVAGVRLPRAGRVPLPLAGLLAAGALEVALQWTA